MAYPIDHLNDWLFAASAMDAGFRGRVRCEPLALTALLHEGFQARYEVIKRFQRTVLDLCQRSLAGDLDPCISRLLLNEIPPSFGTDYHRMVLAQRRDTPVFFRTDESVPGKISEIQCPGSGWGECALLIDYYVERGKKQMPPLASDFARDVRALFPNGEANVLYLLDNCALPNTTIYFIQRTRRHTLRYYAFDRGLRPRDANFIRSHTFLGLIGECNFAERLRLYFEGRVLFDYPPTMIFDQKMPLMLPFWPITRTYFDDDVRALFPHTTLLTASGVTLNGDEMITIDQFAARPSAERDYYLKYASHDIPLHLPGRGVFWLGDMNSEECRALLFCAAGDHHRGKHWILQQGVRQRAMARYFDDDGGEREASFDTKYSAYYGPSGLLCVDVMHDAGSILRQSAGTVIGVCAEPTGTV